MNSVTRATWFDWLRQCLAHGKSLWDTLAGSCFLWFNTPPRGQSDYQEPDPCLIPPMQPPDRPGWWTHIHPNGARYFYKKWEPCGVVTPDNVMEQSIYESLEQNISSLMEDVADHLPQDHDFELWLTLSEEDPEDFDHIFIDHTSREVFCCHQSGRVIKEGEYSYWYYFSRAPMHHHLPDDSEDEMLLRLSHIAGEQLMGTVKTRHPFTVAQCEQLLSLHKTLQREMPHTDDPRDSDFRAWFVSTVMLEICDSRFQKTGRTPERSRYPKWLLTVLNWCLFVVCFGMHERYRLRLFRAHQNGRIQVTTFQGLLSAGSLQEWTDSNLLSTVFISANMAFLAVPNIHRIQQTIVLMSTFFSIASVMVGVHHLWTHRPKTESGANETISYLQYAAGDAVGITFMSVFLCLPLVFLLWAVLSFLVALLHFAFGNYRGDSLVVLACIASVILFTTLCVIVFFYSIWDDEDSFTSAGTERRASAP